METFKVLRKDPDNLRLQVKAFINNPGLAKQAREAFLNTKGFTSFEVSTFSGEVYIGFNASILAYSDINLGTHALLNTYFPGLGDATFTLKS